MKRFVIVLVRTYQALLSPLWGRHCRFDPSCSEYCIAAVERFGVFKGGWLTIVRLCKCQPFHEGGLDPVPEDGPADGVSCRAGA